MTAWVDEIEKRLNAATPGPWSIHRSDQDGGDIDFVVESPRMKAVAYCQEFAIPTCKLNAEFIAHAPVDIAKLIKAHKIMVEALQSIADINEPDSAKTSYWKTEHDCFLADVIVNDVHDAREALKQIEDLE